MDDRRARYLVHEAVERSALTLGAHARQVIEHGLANAVVSGDLVVLKTAEGVHLLSTGEVRKRTRG